MNGVFSDETEPRRPLEEFTEQCHATVARKSPTYYRSSASGGSPYSRLLLPAWGDGHIMMLLGAITGASGPIAWKADAKT